MRWALFRTYPRRGSWATANLHCAVHVCRRPPPPSTGRRPRKKKSMQLNEVLLQGVLRGVPLGESCWHARARPEVVLGSAAAHCGKVSVAKLGRSLAEPRSLRLCGVDLRPGCCHAPPAPHIATQGRRPSIARTRRSAPLDSAAQPWLQALAKFNKNSEVAKAHDFGESFRVCF